MILVEVMPHASVEENKHNTSKCTIEEGELLSFFKTEDTGETDDNDDDEGLICWFLCTVFSFSLSSSMSSELLVCIFRDDDEMGREEEDDDAVDIVCCMLFIWL